MTHFAKAKCVTDTSFFVALGYAVSENPCFPQITQLKDAEVAKNCRTELRQFLEVMGARRNREKLRQLLQDKAYENLSQETARIIALVANVSEFLENEEKYKNHEKEGYNMCQVMEELRAEFREEGMAEGRAEGRAVNTCENIDKLIKNKHWSLEEACEALEVSLEDYYNAKKLCS